MFGFLNVYKPQGITSHDVISYLRRVSKIKQIGHSGTLDPFAEGVLPIGIGKATKLIEYLDDNKAYTGVIQLGKSTSTFDTEGEIINTSDKIITKNDAESVLSLFRGEILQKPPIYSALKINGKKLYEYARKGENIEIKPRIVTILKLELINFDSCSNQMEIYIECSKGTYIRSLANNIGEKLGTYGHLIRLTRVKSGIFDINSTVALDDLKTIDDINNNLINPITCLNYEKYCVNDSEYKLISNGNNISVNIQDGIAFMTKSNQIISAGNVKNGVFYPQKVFI